MVVHLIDIARRRLDVPRGSAPVRALIPVVAKLRGAFARGDRNALARTLEVEGSPRGAESTVVDAPLRVRGTVTVEGRAPMPVDVLLGKDRLLVRTISVPGRRPPRLSLRAELLRPDELFPTPRELSEARDPLIGCGRAGFRARRGRAGRSRRAVGVLLSPFTGRWRPPWSGWPRLLSRRRCGVSCPSRGQRSGTARRRRRAGGPDP
jgi:hypothetical protein